MTLRQAMWRTRSVCLFQVAICFFQYVLMSLMPFAFASFSNQGALLLYSGVCGNVLGPLARALTNHVRLYNESHLLALTVLVMILSIVLIVGAWVPLVSGSLVALLAVVQAILFSFEETSLFTKVAVEVPMPDKGIASRAVGIANQLGACVGSVVGFFIAQRLYALQS